MCPLDNSSGQLSVRHSHYDIFKNISSPEGAWKGGWEPRGAGLSVFLSRLPFERGNACPPLSRAGWCDCALYIRSLAAPGFGHLLMSPFKGAPASSRQSARARSRWRLSPPQAQGPAAASQGSALRCSRKDPQEHGFKRRSKSTFAAHRHSTAFGAIEY